ncbi:MAG: prenyltransferase/squalene oxidase repeat-containing protein [bacterium]|nr:prenyltransferase/squalene oxidase repeat-containing protein [bacterium]
MKKLLCVLIFAATPVCVFADATSTASITVRDGDATAFTGLVELSASTSPPVDVAPTNSSTTVAIPADSLLAVLMSQDATTTDFDITDLQYFSSFNSFLVNCIAIPAKPVPDCFNWTYAVNGAFPQVGIDHTTLHDGDVVYLFFGPPRQTILSTTTASVGEQFTATALRYDLPSGTYVGAPGVTLGAGTANPDFSFTELVTLTTDTNGSSIFTLSATGTFSVGIQEDFYFPSVSITITDPPATTTDAAPQLLVPIETPVGGGSGGGGSGSYLAIHTEFNVPSALGYLASKQHADGSFDSPFLSDWAAMAFSATNNDTAKSSLRNYLQTSTSSLTSATDYERHAMALEALDINPYSGTATNYIEKILGYFDGTQIGDPHLDNDDIFAIFPLLHAGYSANDPIIQKITLFILSAQNANGAWDDSVDMTAAAVQALSSVNSLPDVSTALSKAEGYLHTQQQSNGGWGNSFSTSWALQAIPALNDYVTNWTVGGQGPNDYLASLQQSDGGVESLASDSQTRVWATEYAIPAVLGKTWDSLLSTFAKPADEMPRGSTTASGSSVSASSTIEINATSTFPIATSTTNAISATSSTVLTVQNSTTTTASSQVPTKPKEKMPGKQTKDVVKSNDTNTPSSVSQAATVAAVEQSGSLNSWFFIRVWNAITSFLNWLF